MQIQLEINTNLQTQNDMVKNLLSNKDNKLKEIENMLKDKDELIKNL